MLFIVGALIVIGCVVGGYLAAGGHIHVLWQPFEFIIIGGAATGAFVISNPKSVLSATGASFSSLLKGCPYNKKSYLELLSLLYALFKLAKSKGMLALEPHVENPHESSIFAQFPEFAHNHHAVTFLCDYLRMLTMGTDNPHEIESLMEQELETHHAEKSMVPSAIQQMGDGMPALGIVAAVLGVIHTMGSITEPPEVLGHLIGAALVGTFIGVLMSYGFINPIANSLKNTFDLEAKYFECIKAGLVAYLQGYAPAIAIEFARKSLWHDVRPTFNEVEEAVSALPAMA